MLINRRGRNNPNGLGQSGITLVGNIATQSILTTASVITQKANLDWQKQMEKLRLASDANMSAADRALKEKQLANEFLIAQQRDETFKKIALVAGLGILGLGIIIVAGTSLVGK